MPTMRDQSGLRVEMGRRSLAWGWAVGQLEVRPRLGLLLEGRKRWTESRWPLRTGSASPGSSLDRAVP